MRSVHLPVLIAMLILALAAVPAVASALTVSHTTPSAGAAGTEVAIAVFGTGFASGAECCITLGTAVIYATGVTVVDSSQLQCFLGLPATLAPGAYTVWVRNPGDTSWTMGSTHAFVVLEPLTITSYGPRFVNRGSTFSFTVKGTGFVDGARVAIDDAGEYIEATGVSVVSATEIQCTLAIPATAHLGTYDVDVQNPGVGSWRYLADVVTVLEMLTVTGVSLPAAARGTDIDHLVVYGTGFNDYTEAALFDGGEWIPLPLMAWTATPTALHCQMFIIPPTAHPGTYDVCVRNRGMQDWVIKPDAFTILDTLRITGISPPAGAAGTTLTADIYGSGFADGAGVLFSHPTYNYGSWYPDTETVLSPTHIRCSFTIPASQHVGDYRIQISNPEMNGVVYSDIVFTVLESLTVTGISPAAANRGTTITAHVYGTGFVSGAQVAVDDGNGHWIHATGESVVSANEITCALAIPSTAALGLYDVDVQNPGMSGWQSRADAFTVVEALTVTGSTPAMAARGTGTYYYLDVYGTGFTEHPEVALYDGGQWIYWDVRNGNSSWLRCSVNGISPTAHLGSYDLCVKNEGMQDWAVKADAFTILDTLTVTGVSPTAGARGTTITADIFGTGFADGADVLFLPAEGVGLWVEQLLPSDLAVLSPTHIRCSLTILSSAPVVEYAVEVENPGMEGPHQRSSLFTVLDALTVTGVSPASANRGTTLTAEVYGTGFVPGARVSLWNGAHWVNATQVNAISTTHLQSILEIPSTQPTGAYFVYVLNPGMTDWVHRYGSFVVTVPAGVVTIPGGAGLPTDTNGDGLYDDANGNGRKDFADVVLYFNQMAWIAANEPLSAFDCNGNGRIDFADVVWLFNNL